LRPRAAQAAHQGAPLEQGPARPTQKENSMSMTTSTPPVQCEIPLVSTTASPDVKKALRRVRAISLNSDQVVDVLERLRQLEADNLRLAELLQHCSRHSAQANCGYQQMGSAQKILYDEILGRGGLTTAGAVADAPKPDALQWRDCEFCRCRTNARERICCRSGRDADRAFWDRTALSR
jgi:hypothetical protein